MRCVTGSDVLAYCVNKQIVGTVEAQAKCRSLTQVRLIKVDDKLTIKILFVGSLTQFDVVWNLDPGPKSSPDGEKLTLKMAIFSFLSLTSITPAC